MRGRALLALTGLALVLFSSVLEAASFKLTPREIEEAIRFGKQTLVQEEFGREWQVKDPSGGEATVQTVFYKLALLARIAAFKGQDPDPGEIETVVKSSDGRLSFWVVLEGVQPEFARTYQPALVVEGREVKPLFVQNERTALPLESGKFLARCLYAFPTDGLNPRGPAALIVRTFDGKEVSRFPFDLAAMR